MVGRGEDGGKGSRVCVCVGSLNSRLESENLDSNPLSVTYCVNMGKSVDLHDGFPHFPSGNNICSIYLTRWHYRFKEMIYKSILKGSIPVSVLYRGIN